MFISVILNQWASQRHLVASWVLYVNNQRLRTPDLSYPKRCSQQVANASKMTATNLTRHEKSLTVTYPMFFIVLKTPFFNQWASERHLVHFWKYFNNEKWDQDTKFEKPFFTPSKEMPPTSCDLERKAETRSLLITSETRLAGHLLSRPSFETVYYLSQMKVNAPSHLETVSPDSTFPLRGRVPSSSI